MNSNLPKRRNVFIKKAFQGRLILGGFAVILLSGLCSALLIYWITGSDLLAQSQSAHLNIMTAWQRLGISILIGNMVSILIAGAVAAISVLYASHKIAGPLYRFESLCEQIGNGQLDGVAHLREKDQLQALAQAFTRMLVKLRHQRKQRAELIDTLNSQLVTLSNSPNLTLPQQETVRAMTETLGRFES